MKIGFRVDAASHIGTGHLTRCLTLAKKLQLMGHECTFFSRMFDINLSERITAAQCSLVILGNSFHVSISSIKSEKDWIGVSLDEDCQDFIKAINYSPIDICIVDHYSIDLSWESHIRPLVSSLVVIDDLANRLHDCDILIDQNYFPDYESRYLKLIPNDSLALLGPKFTLLRDEFIDLRQKINLPDLNISKKAQMLINFGGIGHFELLKKILAVITELPKFEYTLVTGLLVPAEANKINKLQNSKNIHLLNSTTEMAKLMSTSQFALGAAGSTVWERFTLGINSALIEMADNQKHLLSFLHQQNLVDNLGNVNQINEDDIYQYIKKLDINSKSYQNRRLHIMSLVDGLGTIRVSQTILDYIRK